MELESPGEWRAVDVAGHVGGCGKCWRVLLGDGRILWPRNTAPVAVRGREPWHVLLGDEGILWPFNTPPVAVVASEPARRAGLDHGRSGLRGREGVAVGRGQRFPVVSISTGAKGNGER